MSRTTIPPAPDDVRLGDVPPKGGPVRPVGLVDGLRRPRVLVPIVVVLLVGLYLVVVRPLLMPGGDTVWVEYALVVVLALTVVLSVLAAVGTLLVAGLAAIAARTRRHTRRWARRSIRPLRIAIVGSLALVVTMLGSQWLAYTPPLGDEVDGGIAALETVRLGDTEQWILVRGTSTDNPVLLFLAGGPGGSEIGKTRGYAGVLEDDFVVVNWEQAGAGKSYRAVDADTLTPERYVEYARELAEQLRERFDEQKIYLLGDSWGSALGVMLVQRYPELFHAFVGTGQMVNFREHDVEEYEIALAHARETGDRATVDKLVSNGPPPYYGAGLAWKNLTLASAVWSKMDQGYTRSGYDLLPATLGAPEYGLLDKAMYLPSTARTFEQIYPQLYDVDLRRDAATLSVPVYFLEGRYDVNALPSYVEDYYRVLGAPHKELIWFEKSGHNVLTEEPDKVADILTNRVLEQTYPGR